MIIVACLLILMSSTSMVFDLSVEDVEEAVLILRSMGLIILVIMAM